MKIFIAILLIIIAFFLYNRIGYKNCLEKAEENYQSFVKLNGEDQENGAIKASAIVWEVADRRKAQDQLVCNQQWK